MIVCDFNIVCITINKTEADTPLIVYIDRILSIPISSKLMELVAGRNLKVVYPESLVNVFKLSPSSSKDLRLELFRLSCGVKLLCTFICEGLNHILNITCHVISVNENIVLHYRYSCLEKEKSQSNLK